MKKVLFLAAFVLLAGVAVNAQSKTKKSCSKTCSKPCTSEKASAAVSNDGATKAISAAKQTENIEMKTCETSGSVSFYRKDVCEDSGKVSYTEVEYLDSTGEFAVKAENAEKAVTEVKTVKAPEVKSKAKSGCCSSKSAKASASRGSKSKSSCSPAARAKSGCSSKSSKKSCSSKS